MTAAWKIIIFSPLVTSTDKRNFMRSFFSLRNFTAVTMVVVILTATVSGFALKKQLLEPFQDTVSHKVFIESDENDSENTMDDDRKPRIYQLEHLATWSGSCTTPLYLPPVAMLLSHEPYRTLPEVYPEIFVPPQNLA